MYERRYEQIQRGKYEIVTENLPRVRKVLDLGCGTGMLLSLLARRSEFVVGVDSSPEMLELARKRRGSAALVLADADHLPFADRSFDAVISVTLLQNMPDPAATVREVARVAKPEGILILTTLKRKHSLGELEGWVRAAGFKPLSSGEVSGEDVFCIAKRWLK
jgi:ubiquinone/menaquinone biosynthesis C-methylase UbiE